ncbi:MAG: diphosphokinase / guanosine-3,5-bis(diphosphate) 3-diphosphatase, partial [Thermoleophilaceae bacterium]|nr:diphosphokinase / guanosine-3,5-bis(diphosphate) 3-diphosphatase [Thermoleophilaceae bacterium]
MPKLPKARPNAGGGTRSGTRAKQPAKGGVKARAAKSNGAREAAPRKTAAKAAPAAGRGNGARAPVDFAPAPTDGAGPGGATAAAVELGADERGLLAELFAVIGEHDDRGLVDRAAVERAFVFSCRRHADQRRQSGEDFIVHPIGVTKICAGMRLDTATLCAALLHDTVEDTTASLVEVRDEFGEEVATLVDGVTKLTGITFQSRDE